MRKLQLNEDESSSILALINELDNFTLTDSGNIYERITDNPCRKGVGFFVLARDLVQLQIIKNKLTSKNKK